MSLPKGMSYDQARMAIERCLAPERAAEQAMPVSSPQPWVREMYEDRIIYQLGDQTLSQRYSFDAAGECVLAGKPTPVTEKRTYVPAKAFGELKAQPMDTGQLDRWLEGKIPRRILVIPFGGPIASEKSSLGVDLDGEWFDGETDLFGPFLSLRASRERLVDWHHDDSGVPATVSRMKGAILGRVVLDEDPESDGYWADWWAKAGERRLALVAALERKSVPLFGSSQAIAGGTRVDEKGHIEVWPLIRHTITTSPQNTLAVVPPLKALLGDGSLSFDEVGVPALRAAFAEFAASVPDLRASFRLGGASFPGGGQSTAKADAVDPETLATLREVLTGLRARLHGR